jgi:hypothetical protein
MQAEDSKKWWLVPCTTNPRAFDGEENVEGVYFYPHETDAKALCAQCPLVAECLSNYGDIEGMIVAGMTWEERTNGGTAHS